MTVDRVQKPKDSEKGLNADELRDCFTLKESCICDTREKIGNWPDYDGRDSLISQGCADTALLAVAAKKDTLNSALAFVHIVKDIREELSQACTGVGDAGVGVKDLGEDFKQFQTQGEDTNESDSHRESIAEIGRAHV